MKARVVFLSAHIKHYRLRFFKCLYQALKSDGIELRVLYGTPNLAHAARHDNVHLPEPYGLHLPSYWLANRFVYQPAWREIAGSDLVITPNEHKLLLNPLLLALRTYGAKRVAFWGKGTIENLGLSNPAEWLRCKTANAVDWWFPYTESSGENLRRMGVRCGITPISNAVDTSELRTHISQLSQECLVQSRYSLGLGSGPVAIFCGNLSANKRLDFLFDAAKKIHAALPDFHLLVVGNGPLREHVELLATRERYVRYLGPRIDREKALALALSNIFLLPGAVGLAILDSFAAGLPLLTTDSPKHGPEIDYLQNGVNGLITPYNPNTFAATVVGLLNDRPKLEELSFAAAATAQHYSIENMVKRFRRGILECLATVPARRFPFSTLLPPSLRKISSGEPS